MHALAFLFLPIDPMYLLFVAPAMALAVWAQWRVKSTFGKAQQIRNSSGMSGAEAALHVLRAAGCHGVQVERAQGFLSDHYDPRAKVLRLSPDVFDGRDLAAVGIAAHEAGHALQDARGYAPLKLRNGLVPLASTGSWLSMILIMGGFLLGGAVQTAEGAGQYGLAGWLLIAGIAAFGLTVVFQLVNLPVEFDASARAKRILVDYGVVRQDELAPVSAVLGAAAMTYVAATLAAVMQLLYFLWRSGLLDRR